MTLRRQLRMLRIVAAVSVSASLLLSAAALSQAQGNRTKFDEIDLKGNTAVEIAGKAE